MPGTLLLSDPGCYVPQFVDDLFRVVQREKKSLGFVFTYVALKVLTVHFTVGQVVHILNERMDLLPHPLLWNSSTVIDFSGASHLPAHNKDFRVVNFSSPEHWCVCFHLPDQFLPWPKAWASINKWGSKMMRQSWLSSPEPSPNIILNAILFFILGVANDWGGSYLCLSSKVNRVYG